MSILLGRELDHASVQFSFKKHVMPPLAGILTMSAVFYTLNAPLINARVKYYLNRHPQAIVTGNPTKVSAEGSTSAADSQNKSATEAILAPTQDPRVLIPKLGVNAPVVFDEKTMDSAHEQLALRRGTLHYYGTANPGQTGTTTIFGHSSGYSWAKGDYKFIFTNLDKLANGDQIIAYYEGHQYIYTVTGRKVVNPDDLSILDQDTKNHKLQLVTCTPVGSDKQRLVIIAEQTSPAVFN